MTHFFSDLDGHLFCEGTHYRTYEKMGAHVTEVDGKKGTHFAVWAPAAKQVSVIGDFNQWNAKSNPMVVNKNTGIWTCFIPEIGDGALYKYFVDSKFNYKFDKSDPYAFAAEIIPQTASRVCTLEGYDWKDQDWMAKRKNHQSLDSPISIYEMHLGSWRRPKDDPKRFLSYKEIAPELVQYLKQMGYTHVEFMPLMEHPFYGSWGYQTVGYFAPTGRYGTPHDLMYLIDSLHQAGIGVILDWVPSHFPQDGHGLVYFDGTHLFEHADPRQGLQPDWGTYVYNYGRKEVRSFLISNAFFWLDQYHIDGLRLDAVASMLYLDYSRKEGQWVANKYGGRENLEAIEFLKQFNMEVHAEFDGVLTIAEESTAWPMVSRPVYLGGLGFSLKWNMGWMHDMLDYIEQDPIHRNYHHGKITFGLMYAFSENFVLAFSHDEVVHLKRSMLSKMPGDMWKQFANLRLLYGYMMSHPGKKLLFMGQDFGQWSEWNHDQALDWQLLEHESHAGLQRWFSDLNHFYRTTAALHQVDFDWNGFQWIDCNDHERSVLSFLRFGKDPDRTVLCVCNFTPIPRYNYRIGVPWGGTWQEILNSDAKDYGGSGMGNLGSIVATEEACHGRPNSLNLTLPPLSALYFAGERPLNQDKHFDELEAEDEKEISSPE